MREIPLGGKTAGGRVALVDDQDYAAVSRYRWHIFENVPGGEYSPYARTGHTFMHTLLTGWARVDHQDGNGLNNQRSNLREATRAQNGANSRRNLNSRSGFKGVSWSQHHLAWKAYIQPAGRMRHLGYFADPVEAARAYDAAALEIWGEFARLNFF